ncbi:MAG: SMP-30/gluconolactonase/LRE family protein [Ferruginibacter sp.]
MNKSLPSIMVLLMVTAIACNTTKNSPSSEELYKSSDLTAVNSFTSGAEGPAVDAEGNLYAVNFFKEGTIGKITPAGNSSLFLELPNKSVGNGIRFNSSGDMLIADYTNHNILKVERAGTIISVYAHDSTMNQPNDIAIDNKDGLYASDPNWKAGTGRIWHINTAGKISLLEDNMGTTNGIEVSPGGNILYVNESVQRKVWAYDLSGSGAISNKRILIEFPDFGMDGMRCDVAGKLYIARHGKGVIAVVAPDGKLVREIKLNGTKPSNIAFGGPDGRTAFVTLQDRGNIETFRVDSPGREWKKR